MPKSPHEQEDELIAKAVRWTALACAEIQKAGGHSPHVLRYFPDELLATMVRNGLTVKHLPAFNDA